MNGIVLTGRSDLDNLGIGIVNDVVNASLGNLQIVVGVFGACCHEAVIATVILEVISSQLAALRSVLLEGLDDELSTLIQSNILQLVQIIPQSSELVVGIVVGVVPAMAVEVAINVEVTSLHGIFAVQSCTQNLGSLMIGKGVGTALGSNDVAAAGEQSLACIIQVFKLDILGTNRRCTVFSDQAGEHELLTFTQVDGQGMGIANLGKPGSFVVQVSPQGNVGTLNVVVGDRTAELCGITIAHPGNLIEVAQIKYFLVCLGVVGVVFIVVVIAGMGVKRDGVVTIHSNLDVLTLRSGFANAAGAGEHFTAGSIRGSFQIAKATLVVPGSVDRKLELVACVQVNGDGILVVAGLFKNVCVSNHLAPVRGQQQVALAGANDCPGAGIFCISREACENLSVLSDGLAEVELNTHGGGSKPANKGLSFFFGDPFCSSAAFHDFLSLQDGVTVHVRNREFRFLLGTTCKQRDCHCCDQQ